MDACILRIATHISRRQPQVCRTAHISIRIHTNNHIYDHTK